jgi:D-alanine-D-alanine ligase
MIWVPLEPLTLVEITPKSGVYDYASRYTAGATDYHAPARVTDEIGDAVRRAATAASTALNLRDITRVDVIVDAYGTPWVLEVNVSPGMTDTSLVPMAAQASGLALRDVCDSIIRAATTRRGREE